MKAIRISKEMKKEIIQIVKASLNYNDIIIVGALPKEFEISEASTSGNLYDDRQFADAYAYTAKDGLIGLTPIVIEECSAQNANGSWVDSYGFNYEELHSQASDALFFVADTGREYSDSNGRSEDERRVEVYINDKLPTDLTVEMLDASFLTDYIIETPTFKISYKGQELITNEYTVRNIQLAVARGELEPDKVEVTDLKINKTFTIDSMGHLEFDTDAGFYITSALMVDLMKENI